jgi:hypothetical protein
MIDEEDDFESTYGDAPQIVPNMDRRYAGVRALWMKVIVRAVFDWVTYRDNTKVDKKKYAEAAYEWLFNKSLLFNSFENICKNLDIDASRIRAQARKMTKDDVAKIEHLERDYEEEEEEKPILKPTKMSYPRLPSKSDERVSNGVI